MRGGRWIAIGVGVAVAVAATVGWRGSRPTSPIAETRGDGVTVVPATGTRAREAAAPAVAALPTASPSPAESSAATPLGLDPAQADRLPELLAAQTRDPAWAPGAEARLRAAFADVPHLGAAPRITCRATLCAVEGSAPNGLSATQSDALFGTLQGSALARTRADFAENMVRVDQPEGGAPAFTIWLVRRP